MTGEEGRTTVTLWVTREEFREILALRDEAEAMTDGLIHFVSPLERERFFERVRDLRRRAKAMPGDWIDIRIQPD